MSEKNRASTRHEIVVPSALRQSVVNAFSYNSEASRRLYVAQPQAESPATQDRQRICSYLFLSHARTYKAR